MGKVIKFPTDRVKDKEAKPLVSGVFSTNQSLTELLAKSMIISKEEIIKLIETPAKEMFKLGVSEEEEAERVKLREMHAKEYVKNNWSITFIAEDDDDTK